jgi:hypothetical protein
MLTNIKMLMWYNMQTKLRLLSLAESERNIGQYKIYILVHTLLGWNMKLALFYNLYFTKVYINLEKYVIH